MEVTTTPHWRAQTLRVGQRLNYEALRKEADHLAQHGGKTRAQIARELNKDRSSITRALQESGPGFARLQREIIAHLSPFRIVEDVQFRVERKATDDEHK